MEARRKCPEAAHAEFQDPDLLWVSWGFSLFLEEVNPRCPLGPKRSPPIRLMSVSVNNLIMSIGDFRCHELLYSTFPLPHIFRFISIVWVTTAYGWVVGLLARRWASFPVCNPKCRTESLSGRVETPFSSREATQ